MSFIETKEQLEAKLAMLRAERKAEIINLKKCGKHAEISAVIDFYDDQMFWAENEYEHCRRD